ncbi:MAG: histidine kinase [Acidobacteria bacterium]|nr:histidine kinase [Acidobacteriota bacterium]MCG3191247.1 hypothetical protein [Thermoanaerobaculia bacterium]
MNPILHRRGGLWPYLALWVPFGGILALLLAASADLAPSTALLVSLPMAAVYAFLCLSSWYVCKATPPRAANYGRMALTLLTAAAIASCLWVLALGTLVNFVSIVKDAAGLPERMPQMVPVVFSLGVLLYLLSAALHYVLLMLDEAAKAELEKAKARELAREAELTALKAQVNPHFLFNSLNSISSLTSHDPAKAREMCTLLADYLRKTLGLSERRSVRLSEEISLAQNYLAVEKVRFGERLRFAGEIDPGVEDCEVPPLLLQPLVENAIKHGASAASGGEVKLRVKKRPGEIEIRIENPFEEGEEAPPGTGLGLRLVAQRIRSFYGARGRMTHQVEPGRFLVELSLPMAEGTH